MQSILTDQKASMADKDGLLMECEKKKQKRIDQEFKRLKRNEEASYAHYPVRLVIVPLVKLALMMNIMSYQLLKEPESIREL